MPIPALPQNGGQRMTDDHLILVTVSSWVLTTLFGVALLVVVGQRNNISKKLWEALDGYNAACQSNRDLTKILKDIQKEDRDAADWWKEEK